MLIAFFTGGAAAVAKVVKSYTNFFTTVGKAIGKTAKQGYKAVKNIFEWLQAQLDELFEAINNNNLGEWLNKKLDEFFGEEKADEVIDITTSRAKILAKWIDKFDKTFFNHLDGELGIAEYLSKNINLKLEYLEGQGGHNANAFKKSIRKRPKTKFEPDPPVTDQPFEATIDILYKNEWLPKMRKSSMFPENWDLNRIQEEIAWVYENTVPKGVGKLPKKHNQLFNKYQAESTTGFDILIEVDDAGNIMNSYPIIN